MNRNSSSGPRPKRTTPREQKERENEAKKLDSFFGMSSVLSSTEISSIFKSPADKEAFIEKTFFKNTRELAQDYNVSEREVWKLKGGLRDLGENIGEGGFPISTVPKCDDYMVLRDNGPIIVMGDAEVPEHDATIFDMIVSVAQGVGAESLVINGDFLSLDSFSKWPKSTPYQLTFEQELETARESINIFLKTFKRIIYLTGNHEKRINNHTQGHVSLKLFFEPIYNGSVNYSEYAHCIVENCGEEYFVCHPKNYRQVPLSVPIRLASLKLKHIISGHTHRLAFGYDISSQFYIVESGHCRDKERTSYKSKEATLHPEWNAGFVLLMNGVPHLIDKKIYERHWAEVSLSENYFLR